MNELFQQSAFFGVLLTLGAYKIGAMLQSRFRWAVFNPLLVSIVLIVAFLLALSIPYEHYNSGARFLSYLFTPATVCLAVPLYAQFSLLRKNWKAVLGGVVMGVVSSAVSVLGLCILFRLDHAQYVSFLPKSVTTAIGLGVSEELGGVVPLTVIMIVLTGVLGNVIASPMLRFMRISDPIAKGIAIGSSAHAMGTAKAVQMGQVEGAMSSLSIVVSGIITVAVAGFFAELM